MSYPETQTMALMVSSDLRNLQIYSEPEIMKQQRINPFKIASKCQEIHFKHTKTQSRWRSLHNRSQIACVLCHRPLYLPYPALPTPNSKCQNPSLSKPWDCFEILRSSSERSWSPQLLIEDLGKKAWSLLPPSWSISGHVSSTQTAIVWLSQIGFHVSYEGNRKECRWAPELNSHEK